MADIFTKPDVAKLLRNKRIVFLGDSNTRPLYKDIVCLLNHNSLISSSDLRRKLEPSFMGDRLLRGDKLTRGRDYEEVRQYKCKDIHLEFYFITRCLSRHVEEVAGRAAGSRAPDVIVMNSVLWDITRWGPQGVERYKDNLVRVMKLFKRHLSPDTLLVWNTAPPISKDCYGGTLIKQIEFLKHTLRFEVMEANMFARDVVGVHGFHVLDMHYYLRMHVLQRARDGIHWLPHAVRYMTNLLLTHIALSFEEALPGRYSGPLLTEMVELMKPPSESIAEVALPAVPVSLLKDAAPSVSIVQSPFRSPFRQPAATKARRKRKLRGQENHLPCLVAPKLKVQEAQSSQPPWCSAVPNRALPRLLETYGGVLKPVNTAYMPAPVAKNCAAQLRTGKENYPAVYGRSGAQDGRHSAAPSLLDRVTGVLEKAVVERVSEALEKVLLERAALERSARAWRDSYRTSALQSVVCVPTAHSSRSRRRPMPY